MENTLLYSLGFCHKRHATSKSKKVKHEIIERD